MGKGGVGDPPVSRYTWLSGAAQQQLEAVGLGPPAKFSSVQRLQLHACLAGALPERYNRQDLHPAASPCACSCPQPSLLTHRFLFSCRTGAPRKRMLPSTGVHVQGEVPQDD